MDAVNRIIAVNTALGEQITRAKGWVGPLAVVHGAHRHPSGFSQHFVDYAKDVCKALAIPEPEFLKSGRAGFGGFTRQPVPSDKPVVILVHGNGCDATTMSPVIKALMKKGFKAHDVYALSYGKGDPNQAPTETHAPAYSRDIRTFLNIVAAYTRRPLIVVGHSKGVTDSQLAIHGVSISDSGVVNRYAAKLPVMTFIGCAGANKGLKECELLPFLPTASRNNGFHPGSKLYSVLPKLGKVAEWVASEVARNDELLNDELESASVPFQDEEVILETGGHMGPIWNPEQLVELIMRQHAARALPDTFELVRSSSMWPGVTLPFAMTDAMITAGGHFAEAGVEAAGLKSDAFLRATCGMATLAHAAQAAMLQMPMMPFQIMSELMGGRSREDDAIAGKITSAA